MADLLVQCISFLLAGKVRQEYAGLISRCELSSSTRPMQNTDKKSMERKEKGE